MADEKNLQKSEDYMKEKRKEGLARLMEKMSRISMGYFNGTTQGAIKKIMTDDVEEIVVFVAQISVMWQRVLQRRCLQLFFCSAWTGDWHL